MDQFSVEQKHPSLVVVGGDSALNYLLGRYAELIGYPVSFEKGPSSVAAIQRSEPAAVIFPSVEMLAGAQALAAELTNLDIPIIVCSSILDQAKTRELGADYCLLHPLVFDSFSYIMQAIATSQQKVHTVRDETLGSSPINPV